MQVPLVCSRPSLQVLELIEQAFLEGLQSPSKHLDTGRQAPLSPTLEQLFQFGAELALPTTKHCSLHGPRLA
jgi:hypothetical protein